MQRNETLPALQRKFLGHEVTVPQAFAAGDTLDADSAAWVNSQIATVIGNATGGYFRRSGEKPTAKAVQSKLDEIFAEYNLSGNRGTGEGKQGSDPVASLVKMLATQAVKARIVAKGLKVRDFVTTKVTDEDGNEVSKLTQLIAQYIENHPELRDTAEAQINSVREEASEDTDIDLAA